MGDIGDGNFIFAGIVEDISSRGIRMSHLPKEFSADKANYRTVISGYGRHFKVMLRPCWSERNKVKSTVITGFLIID